MIGSKLLRRGAQVTLLATLLSVPAVVAGATSALADQNCTGKLKNSGASNHSIGYYIDGAYRGEVIGGATVYGTPAHPINQFRINSGHVADITYKDLRTGANLGTHYNVIAGKYNKNPCHSGEVYVH